MSLNEPIEIRGERILLRDLEDKDLKSMADAVNNLNVSRHLLVVPHPYGIEDARWFIDQCKKHRADNPRTSYNFAIEFQKNFAGVIGLSDVDQFTGTAALGYWIAEEHWGKGIGSEAGRLIINFAFTQLKLRRINVEAFAGNAASQALIKKLGFTEEGFRKQFDRSKATGDIHDSIIYGLLYEDWKAEG